MNQTLQPPRDYIIQQVADVLSSFFAQFAKNPFSFFYEEDVRSHLFVQLDKSIKVVSRFPIDNRFVESINSPLVSSIVKAEYPQSGKSSRFDIAILAPESVGSFYISPVSIAIEVKLGSEHLESDKTGFFKGDVHKLVAAKQHAMSSERPFLGIAVYFHQTPIKDESKFRSYYFDTFQDLRKIPIVDIRLMDNTIYAFVIAPSTDQSVYSASEIAINMNAANAS